MLGLAWSCAFTATFYLLKWADDAFLDKKDESRSLAKSAVQGVVKAQEQGRVKKKRMVRDMKIGWNYIWGKKFGSVMVSQYAGPNHKCGAFLEYC